MCPSFTLIHLSTPSVSWFCHIFTLLWSGLLLLGSLFGFGGSGVEIKHKGLHVFICGEDNKMFWEIVPTPTTEHDNVWVALS